MSQTVEYPPDTWNRTAHPYRRDIVPARLIVEAARRAPDAPAVLTADGTAYTYGELLTAANRLAGLLEHLGVGPGDYVGVVGRHRPDTVVGLLGVALSGAAFVPCHPDWPDHRLAYVLGSAGVRCLVGGAADLARIDGAPGLTDLVLLDVADERPPLLPGTEDPPRRQDAGADPQAYARHVSRIVLADRPASLLEIGFGAGAMLRQIAPHIDLYAGLDSSAAAVRDAVAWTKHEGIFADLVHGHPYQVADLLPGRYDVALLSGGLRDLPGLYHLRAVLDRLAEVVRPGGAVVLAGLLPPGTDAAPGSLVLPAEFPETLRGGVWSRVERRRSRDAGCYEIVLRRAAEPAPVTASGGPRVHTGWHLARRSGADRPLRSRPGDVAYVIYTSGSTGRPKGVSISNTALVNMLEWVTRTFGVGPHDRLLQVTSFCFDLSIYDVFGLLAAGGSIRLATEEDLAEPARLAHLLLSEPITFWNSAPPLFAWVLPFLSTARTDGPGRTSMRLMFLAGDWIALSMPDEIRTVFPNVSMVSYGGATETTVWSTYHVIERVDPGWASIPYGRPMQNARFYVLDENRAPAPIGVPGELYAAGDCLALGYHGDPAQTAQRFVPDPFVPGERMYACGDRGRWRPDGELQFLGRVDHQVKIRGYRVELGEIESVITSIGSVREAAVVTVDLAGERSLAAFYTCRPPGAPVERVHAVLAGRLPEYMVPARLSVLDELPLTPNGKVDRAALAELARTRPVVTVPGGDA